MTSCSICPPGTTSEAGAQFCICQAGHHWNGTDCSTCPLNSVSQVGALKCMECPEGSLSVGNQTSCFCSTGLFWNWEQGSGSCVSTQGLSSWHSSKSLEALELVGLLVLAIAVAILALGLLASRAKRYGRKEDKRALMISNDKDGDALVVSGEVENTEDSEREFGKDGDIRNPEGALNMAFIEDDNGHADEAEFKGSDAGKNKEIKDYCVTSF